MPEHCDGPFFDDPVVTVPHEPIPVLARPGQSDRSVGLPAYVEVVGAAAGTRGVCPYHGIAGEMDTRRRLGPRRLQPVEYGPSSFVARPAALARPDRVL